MDNLVLDELGALALRQGSQKINTTALARTYGAFDHTADWEIDQEDWTWPTDGGIAQITSSFEREYFPGSVYPDGPANHNYAWEVSYGFISDTIDTDEDCHSLFTVTLDGSRYRMTGADDAVYANGTAITDSVDGSGDIAFAAHMGHILFARGETKLKFDGTAVRHWGIDPLTGAPTLSALSADSKVFASCASAESPTMTQNEGTQAFQPDKAGTANAAVEIQPSTTTGRGVSTKTFASPTDFTAYDGGQEGTDEDLIDFYTFVTEPQYIDSITLMIDVNDGTFQEDWYDYTFHQGDAIVVTPSADDSLQSNYDVEGYDRHLLEASLDEPNDIHASYRQDTPSSNTGWNHFSLPRGRMVRHGLTSGKNWSTVKAVRIIVNAIAGGSGAAVRFDEIKIIGGSARPLTGKFKAAIVAARNDGTYQALSAPSTYSDELEVKAQGIRATISAAVIAALDQQVNELHLFLMGGRLNAFYRFAVKTGGPFSGSQTIDANISEITAQAANIRMETHNAVPPDDIIMIEGPHFDRTLALTAEFIYPSRQRNPDSFSSREVVRVGDAAETALWIKKLGESGLYVGTNRDIYRMDGDWTVQPDGSINVTKRPMHVSEPPISAAVEVGSINGIERLIYLAGDGWHSLQGGHLVDGSVDLLWRGFTRHGVDYVNVTGTTARFRSAVSKNVLFCITPEGTDTTSSDIIHAYHFTRQRWYRFDYPQAFRSIHAEPDGTLIAGDASGFVRILDLATKQDDGANIPVVLWTPNDDNGEPFTYKGPLNMWMRVDTAGDTATVAFHLNGNSVANTSTTTAQAQTDTANVSVASVSDFSQLQLRITGSFSTFVMRGWLMNYLDSPLPAVIHDTGPVDLSGDILKWVKRIRVKAKSTATITVANYWDGVAGTSRSITPNGSSGLATVFDVPLGREDKGRVARTVLTAAAPFHVYWVEYVFNGSGKQLQKRVTLVPEVQ